MKGRFPDCHPTKLMKALLCDHRIETMMKAGDRKSVAYFIYHLLTLTVAGSLTK